MPVVILFSLHDCTTISKGEGYTSPTPVVKLEESIDNNASASILTPNTIGVSGSGSGKGAKPPKPRSKVWDHFTKFTDPEDEELKSKCNYCSKIYLCSSKRHGTLTLNNHVASCIHNPNNVGTQQAQCSFKSREGS